MLDPIKVTEYANALYRTHGDAAEGEAAQRERQHSAAGEPDQAADWRRIRAAIRERRGALQG